MKLVETVWYGPTRAAGAARAMLWPLARLYGAAMAVRQELYDAHVLRSTEPEVATIGVGNLTVGGTGKTPVAAWIAARLAGVAKPAVLLRGYGDDEVEVHRRLNPEIPVVVAPDRVAGVAEARRQGADVVVLDDAFQHQRLRRTADILLLSVEQLMRPLRLLPVGPWREPLTAARRADVVVLTRKSASAADAARAAERLRAQFPGLPLMIVHLAPAQLVSATDASQLPLARLRGLEVAAIAAIGEPDAFRKQLEQAGATVHLQTFRDHHRFSADELSAMADHVPADRLVLCTLKDAVKLVGRWPGPSRLWYVSQQLVVEEGAEALDRLLASVLEARSTAAITAG